jgi:rubrerythrin
MHAMTMSHLRDAHGGESMAHMRYQIWGGLAKEEGYPNVSRLFAAISSAETIHATNHFHELRTKEEIHYVLRWQSLVLAAHRRIFRGV